MKARVIALYLPQYHPIPENDEWWGKGFTEWTNVAKARPLFKGHYQPRIPADLGFYDLRLPEVREQQAQLACEAGIEGFCYYHYWFGNGKQLLERPFNAVLVSGKPDFTFCLCWAKHDWTNTTWQTGKVIQKDSMIMQMHYSHEDHIKHFLELLPAFRDKRYIKVDGKPLFAVWAPRDIPEETNFISTWQSLAIENGLPGIHFVGYTTNATGRDVKTGKLSLWNTNRVAEHYNDILERGYDAVMSSGLNRAKAMCKSKIDMLIYHIGTKLHLPVHSRTDYEKVMRCYYTDEDAWDNVYPTLLPQWDRTPRAGVVTDPLLDSTPEKFQRSVREAVSIVKDKVPEHRILFLKAWNEWGEGNYVEPDLKFGHGYIKAIKAEIDD